MRRSFRDPTTHALKAHGYMRVNEVGDLDKEETDDFNLEPGKWRWDGSRWVAYTPPPSRIDELGDQLRTSIQNLINDPIVPTTVKDAIIALARFVKDEFNGQ